MTPLTLKRSDTPYDYEQYLADPNLGKRELRLPKFSSLELGGAVALTQFVLTWSRLTERANISCYMNEGDIKSQKDFVSRVNGLAAVYFSKNVRAEDNGDVNLRKSMLSLAKDRMEAMFGGRLSDTCKGMEVEMIFVRGAEREFHGSFYKIIPTASDLGYRQKHGELIRDKSELSAFAEDCFRAIGLASKQGYLFDWPDFILGSILSEAFRNTAEHAYLMPDGSQLGRNLRCVRMARVEVSREMLRKYKLSSKKSTEAAVGYFERLSLSYKKNSEKREKVQFLEISIFDSGVGFAKTIASERQSGDDISAVIACFEKHGTSKKTSTSGAGLNRILESISVANGFIRVRTSRVEAFFCGGEGFSPDMPPRDFVHSCENHVEGSVLTIGIPIAL